ncbi:histidine kinase [Geodermatophilus sp. URMC 64]
MQSTVVVEQRRAPALAPVLAAVLVAAVAVELIAPALGPGGYRTGWLWWTSGPVAAAAFGTPAVLLLRRDPRSVTGAWLAVVAVLSVVAQAAAAWAWLALVGRPEWDLPGGEPLLWVAGIAWLPGYFLLPTVLLLLAPDGRLPGPRWRPVLAGALVAIALVTVLNAVTPYRTGAGVDTIIPDQPASLTNPLAAPALAGALGWSVALLPLSAAAALAALVVRWRRAGDRERRQLRVVLTGAVATVVLMAATFAVPHPWFLLVVALALVPYPLALGVAAARHGLFDLDLVVRRSVVFGLLSGCVVAAYVLAIVGLGGVLGRTTGAPLVATAVVAVGAAPLHAWLQRRVDRWLYGHRSDPAGAVRGLAERWQAGTSLDDVACDLATGLRLPSARISTAFGPAGAWGTPREPLTRVPLRHAGTVVGELVVGTREPGRPLPRRDVAALEEMATYVAVVVHALALTEDLQRSRERIVVAREEERRRLRRDLHDGLGPELASIALQLETVRDLADGPGTPAGALVESLRGQLRGVLGEVRRIVDDLRPPVLDDLGLAEALAQLGGRFTGSSTEVDVDVADLPPLSAATELALLRIAGEALTNATRHGRATRCAVTLAVEDGLLALTVSDNGRGLAGEPERPGVGLASMRERALELGGSCTVESVPGERTTVRALLPLERTS